MEDLRKMVEDMLDPSGHWQASKREIVCTATVGAYHKPAYWIVVLGGSPPKAAMVIQSGWNENYFEHGPRTMVVDSQGNFRKCRVSEKSADTLRSLMYNLAVYLEGKTLPCVAYLRKDGVLAEKDG